MRPPKSPPFALGCANLLLLAALPSLLRAETIQLTLCPLDTNNPGGLGELVAGDLIFFQVGVRVDLNADPLGRGVGNKGLGLLAYDVSSPEAVADGYLLSPMQDFFSGFDVHGEPAVVSSPFYSPSDSATPNYGGGWGFDRGGLAGGGDVTTTPGEIAGANIAAPASYQPDVNPNAPGMQPNVRLGVGILTYVFPVDDPILGGKHFGCDGAFLNEIGDVTWLLQSGVLDTAGWAPGQYDFNIIPAAGQVFDGSLDYNQTHLDGFLLDVAPEDMLGDSFSFTLVPECPTFLAFLVGGLIVPHRTRRQRIAP